MNARYRTEAINTDGGHGVSNIVGGMAVPVSSPLASDFDTSASNPEQLLALAWVTCLNSTAQAIVRGERRTSVRATVELHPAEPGPGYEFRAHAYLSAEGLSAEDAEQVLAAAHSRCPVSKLMSGAATVHVHTEEYTAA